MFNERNQRIESAGPAEPAIILGLNGAPTAGDTFHVMETEQEGLLTSVNSCSVSKACVHRLVLPCLISLTESLVVSSMR